MTDLQSYHDANQDALIICEAQKEQHWIKSDYYVKL